MPDRPDTGPAFTKEQHHIAVALANRREGMKLCYTLALALQGIAEELAANMEPEKFLTRDEALQLANALMQEIPAEWQGDAAETEIPPQTIGDM